MFFRKLCWISCKLQGRILLFSQNFSTRVGTTKLLTNTYILRCCVGISRFHRSVSASAHHFQSILCINKTWPTGYFTFTHIYLCPPFLIRSSMWPPMQFPTDCRHPARICVYYHKFDLINQLLSRDGFPFLRSIFNVLQLGETESGSYTVYRRIILFS